MAVLSFVCNIRRKGASLRSNLAPRNLGHYNPGIACLTETHDMATDLQTARKTYPTLPICNHVPEPYVGPSRQEVIALRQQYVTPGLITYYKDPLIVVEGKMQYVWDETGKR